MPLLCLRFAVLALLLSLFAPSLYGQEKEVDAEAQAVARAFIRAIYTGDSQAVKDNTLDMPRIEDLSKKDAAWEKPSQADVKAYMDSISLRGFPRWSKEHAETHYAFIVSWSGTQCQLPLCKVDGRWKVDARWWLAFQDKPGEGHVVCKAFMYAMISGDAVAIEKLAVADENLWTLSHGRRPPGGEMGQYHHICESMPLVRLKMGEVYYDPSQKKRVTLDEAFKNNDQMLLVGQFGVGSEIPFVLVKDDEKWRVDVSPWIQRALVDLDEKERAAGQKAYPSRLRKGRVDHAVRDPEGLKQLKVLLKEDLPQKELNRALHVIADQYWYVMQFDNKKPADRLLAMAAALLETGADSNTRNEAGEIVLVKMISYGNGGHEKMIGLLLKHGADPQAQDADGDSAVSCLAKRPNAAYQRVIDAALNEEQ